MTNDILQKSISDEKITQLYLDGESCAAIARITECSETSVYNRLKIQGIKIRSRSEANKIFPDSIFINLYNMGLSTSQIGKLLGVNPSTITKRLHTIQFPLRFRNVASRIRYTEKEFRQYFMVPDIIGQLMELTNV